MFREISVHASTFLCTAPGTHLVTARGGIAGGKGLDLVQHTCSDVLQHYKLSKLGRAFVFLHVVMLLYGQDSISIVATKE